MKKIIKKVEWKIVPGHSNYMVSRDGKIKSLARETNGKGGKPRKIKEKILKPNKNEKGYLRVSLDGKTFGIHQLVALAFIPNPNNYKEINHINENKSDNRIENLEWCTRYYNLKYSNCTEKATEASKRRIKCIETGEKFESIISACRKYNIKSRGNINKALKTGGTCYGYHWEYIDKKVIK